MFALDFKIKVKTLIWSLHFEAIVNLVYTF